MNRSLKVRFEAELKKLGDEGIAGEALEKYLLDRHNKRIKIPNAVYCVLQMLGDEHENHDVIYTEYCGKCFRQDCAGCRRIGKEAGRFQWCFWYTRQKYALDITGAPVYSLGLGMCDSIVNADRGENDIQLKIYAKFAYQCMAIYDTGYECYLPTAFFRMAEYMLFFCSYKAFFAALKSAVKYCDAEMNYIIREALGTMLGLKDVQREDLYGNISRMQGNEKAAVTRVIAGWELGGDLLRGLYDIIQIFTRNLCRSEIRKWIEEHETELEEVLGIELLYQLQEHCHRNATI